MLFKMLLVFIVKVISAGGVFLFNIIISRYLGAAEAGYFFLAQAICLVLANVSRQGFDNAIVKFWSIYISSNEYDKARSLATYALIRVSVVSLIIGALVFVFSKDIAIYIFNKPLLQPSLSLSASVIFTIAMSQLLAFLFQGDRNATYAMLYQSALLAIIGFVLIWAFKPSSSEYAMGLYSFGSFIVLFFALVHWFFKNKFGSKKYLTEIDLKSINLTLKPLFSILVLIQVSQWASQLFLGVFCSSSDVAIFSAAQRTAMLNSFILVAVNMVVAPGFASLYKDGDIESIKNIVKKVARFILIISIPVLLLEVFLSKSIMSLFGSEFIDGYWLLIILSIGQFVNVITGSVAQLLQMTGHEKIYRNNIFVSGVILVIGLVFLVPSFGVYGAAISTAVAVSVENLLSVYKAKKNLGINTLNVF